MIICFECSHDTKQQLDTLVGNGHYKDYSEVIKVAIANQTLLHQKVGPQGSLVVTEEANTGDATTTVVKRPSTRVLGVDYTYKKIIEPTIPDIFRTTHNPLDHEAAPLPDDVWSENIGVPVERWIFGQYNKLFPVKASCRALANIFSSKQARPSMLHISREIAMHAVELGRYLLHHDLQHAVSRDERLSTAFPTPDPLSDKGRERYAKQFVISINKSGQPSSLLVDFKFLNFTREKQPRVMLTEPGWYFALLSNPVLDDEQQNPLERFNQREKEFLIEHIISYVPAERFAYRSILNAVVNGEDTPDKLGVALRAYVRNEKIYTPSFLAAQRSGAISRMADLGLLVRSRDGVRVTYKVTQDGHNFLERAGNLAR